MIKVYTNKNITMVGIVRAALENSEIECVIKNDNLTSTVGEMPFLETWPEVWIFDEAKQEQAKSLVQEIITDKAQKRIHWTCENCNEISEDQFTECWNCNRPKP